MVRCETRRLMLCVKCGINETRVDGLGRLLPWCHDCIIQVIDDYVASAPHLPDDEQALIKRYEQALADLNEAVRCSGLGV